MAGPALPARLDARPKYKGLPVPFTVPWENGIPDFKGTDPERYRDMIVENLCALCGQENEDTYWFIGGPGCVHYLMFQDGPMHEDCARAAAAICPFIVGRKDYAAVTKRNHEERTGQTIAGPAVLPAKMMLVQTPHWEARLISNGGDLEPALCCAPFTHTEEIPRHVR